MAKEAPAGAALSRSRRLGDTMSEQAILVTGAAGFHRLSRRAPAAGRRPRRRRVSTISTTTTIPRSSSRGWICCGRIRASISCVPILRIGRRSPRCSPNARFEPWSHLAAQAGVRYSIEHPHAYVDANLEGFAQYSGRMPAQRMPSSGLCFVVVGLWRQHQAAVFGSATAPIIPSAFTPRRRRPTS